MRKAYPDREQTFVLASSQVALYTVFILCVFFGDQFIISDGVQHQMLQFLCGAQWLFDIYTVSSAQKTSDGPESIWNPSCTHHPLESTSGPAIGGKAAAPPYAAAIQFLGREPDPPKSGWSPSALARILHPPQSGSISSATIHLLLPSGVTAAIAERFLPFLKKMQFWKGVCSLARSGAKRQQRVLQLDSLAMECCKEVWLLFQTFVFSGSNFEKKAQLGGLRGRPRCFFLRDTGDIVTSCAVFGPARRDEKSGNTLGKLVSMRENP